ncbi:MAG: hypothetical protein JO187_13400 [Acidobacteria bacterium]|nr:hypothetical protein [Acidobacteriota bacterium]
MRLTSIACLLVFTLTVAMSSLLWGQANDVYQLTYYDNNFGAQAPFDAGTIRIVNPGLQGSPIASNGLQGTLCANIYVFDDTQEMVECCSCPITANGVLTISVQDLTDNPLTTTPFRGVIKVVSTTPLPSCDATKNAPTPDLRAFSSHLQNAAFGGTTQQAKFFITESEFADAPLGSGESSDLGTICSFVRYLGTGRGQCDTVCSSDTIW